MLPADDEEEDGADGEEEEEDGQDHDGDEVGVEGVLHGGGDDGGDGEGGLEEGEVAQRGLPVLQTTLDLGSKLSGTFSSVAFIVILSNTFLRISNQYHHHRHQHHHRRHLERGGEMESCPPSHPSPIHIPPGPYPYP